MATPTTNRAGAELVERLAERIGTSARAAAVFGDPVTHGEVTVIPVARTSFGFGGGSSPDPDKNGRTGEGGGGGAIIKPIGYIQLGPSGARYRPIPDRRLLFGLVALGLLLIARAARTIRARPSPAPKAAGAGEEPVTAGIDGSGAQPAGQATPAPASRAATT